MQFTAPILIISTLLLLPSARLVPRRKNQPRQGPGHDFPSKVREPGQTFRPDLHIPNPKFCEKMALQPAMHYMVIISLHITKALSKKKYSSSSEESIENLLYYQDCQHRRSPTTATSPKPIKISEPAENPCPFPKMCCSMSCDDQCNNGMGGMSSMGSMSRMLPRQQDMMQPIMHSMNPTPPRQPHFTQSSLKTRSRKRPFKPEDLLPPIGGRREFGFTKDKIKSLISQDGDIRKILKDLVRVTMQKVDLIDILNARKSDGGGAKVDEHEQLYSDDDELE